MSTHTAVCELLGIDHPIVSAPMAADPRLPAAVSNAGALGTIGLWWVDDAGDLVRETAALTDRPFGGNFALTSDQHRRVDQALSAGLRIVSFIFGDPQGYVESVHDAGGLVMHTVGSAEEARRAVGCGVDIIVAQGWEAGGHVWGGVATLPLVPAVVDAVAPVPVIAAGGIGDARGVAAVLALGAQAAWLGTRFLLADEMPIQDEYRRLLTAATETDAEWYANLYEVGWPDAPHRALHNSTAERWEAAGRPPPGSRPGEGEVIAHFASGDPILRYSPAPPMDGTTGEIEALSLWAGSRRSGTATSSIQAQRGGHPAERHFTIRRILGGGDLWVSECVITYDGVPTCSLSIMEITDGLVTHETQYFADPFPAPPARAALAESIPARAQPT
jgi:nitronate monooxygenase